MNIGEAMSFLDLQADDIAAKPATPEMSFSEAYRARKLLEVATAFFPPESAAPLSGCSLSRMQAEVLHLICNARIVGDQDRAVKLWMVAGALAPMAYLERKAFRAERG